MNHTIRALAAALLALGCIFLIPRAHASVVIAGTRVIFPAADGETTVRLSNESATPALVEAWIDDGDPQATPDKVNTPFLIAPPLFRMEPHVQQSLRILFTHSDRPLPEDRESVFWLNVLEVPPKPSGAQTGNHNYLQMAIRQRLKLFYRPAGLAGDPGKAPGALSFHAAGNDGPVGLVVHNPTPYYVTISHIAIESGGTTHEVESGMVAPRSDLRLAIAGLQQLPATGSAIDYHCINDYGADVALKGTVSP